MNAVSKVAQHFAPQSYDVHEGDRTVESEKPGHSHFDPNTAASSTLQSKIGNREPAPQKAWEDLKLWAREAASAA